MILSFFDPIRNPLSFFDPLRDPLKDNAVVPQKYVEALERQGWVKAIRCKDCKHYFPDYMNTIDGNVVVYRCELDHDYGRDDYFCADGERAPTCGPDYCEIGGGDNAR